jgi:hypothetical protein
MYAIHCVKIAYLHNRIPRLSHTLCTNLQTFNHFSKSTPQQLQDSQNPKQTIGGTRVRAQESWISQNSANRKVRMCAKDGKAGPRAQVKWRRATMLTTKASHVGIGEVK